MEKNTKAEEGKYIYLLDKRWAHCSGLGICGAQLYVWQTCETRTENWALSMLVSLSQSLTQWEGTQRAQSAQCTSGEPCMSVAHRAVCVCPAKF